MSSGAAEPLDRELQEAKERLQEALEAKERLQVVTLRLPRELISRLDHLVEEHGYSSRSELVRQLLDFSLSGKTFNVELAQQAGEKFISPILPRIENILKEIAAALPKDKLMELGAIALIPFAQFVSAIAGISVEEVAQGLGTTLGEIIGKPEES